MHSFGEHFTGADIMRIDMEKRRLDFEREQYAIARNDRAKEPNEHKRRK